MHPQVQDYVCTPCGHPYHKPCLISWFDHKLLCPICKTTIPPLI
jgi:hypothetical protein